MTLSPRSYNVDPTGRQFVLDPDPLLDVAARGFAMQQETMRQVAEVGKEGIKTAEFIAARQQLGRVKAQLGELDVNDPLFSQKYSAVVSSNPLAFTNEKIAPVTKAAVTPVLSAASSAMEQRAALERAQVMAGNQQQAAQLRYGYQQAAAEDRFNNQLALAETRFGYQQQLAAERAQAAKELAASRGQGGLARMITGAPSSAALTGGSEEITESPTVPPGVAPPSVGAGAQSSSEYVTQGQFELPPLPTNQGTGGAGVDSLLPPIAPEGQPDNLAPTPRSQVFDPLPNNPQGQVNGEGSGDSAYYKGGIYTNPQGQSFRLNKINLDGVEMTPYVAGELTPEQKKERDAAIDLAVKTDPNIASLQQNADLAAARYAAAEKAVPNIKDEAARSKAADELTGLSSAAALAVSAAKNAEAQRRLEMLAQSDPAAAKIVADRYLAKTVPGTVAALREGLFGGFGMSDLTDSPPVQQPTTPPTSIAPVREQITKRDNAPLMKTWDEEKVFALRESEKLDAALGYAKGTVAKTIAEGNAADESAILKDAYRRGIKSPLLGTFTSQEATFGPKGGARWGNSSRLGKSYRSVLAVGYTDPDARRAAAAQTNAQWAEEGFVIRAKNPAQ